MSTIPVSLTQEQFEQYIRPCLSVAKRGYECRIPLYKIFNYILYRLHTGCQWERLPIDNKRSRKKTKRGPKRLFSPQIYKLRFSCERTFAWIDNFRALLVRFDRKAAHFMGAHFIVYALINLRHLLAEEKSQ